MTNPDLKTQLIADPSAAISYIVNNNPDAVIDVLRGYGFNIARFDDIEDALNTLLKRGENDKFLHALSVPFITENADPGEVIAVKDASIALNARAGKNVAKKFDVNALFAGLANGTLTYLEQTDGKVNVKPDNGSGKGKDPEKPKSQTWLYIGIGAAALTVLIIILLLLRKQ